MCLAVLQQMTLRPVSGGERTPPNMKNATQNKSGEPKSAHDGSSQWPVRNEAAAAALHRTREMPLLFQLADVNRTPVAAIPPAPAVSQTPAAPATPAPLELPTASTFPLVSSILESWPTAASIFDVPTGLGTPSHNLSSSALAIGVAAAKETAKPAEAPTAVATAAVEKPAEKAIEKTITKPTPASSMLPAAIDTALKAATETIDAAATKTETKLETKVEAKVEVKPEPKTPAKNDSIARPKTAAPAAETTAAATKTATAETKAAEAKTTPPAAANDKPSPASLRRQRAEARQAKVEGKGGDWLQTHGKVIAICFVIALIGTIYLARRNRGTSAPEPIGDSHNVAIEIPGEGDHKHEHQPTEAANTAPRLVEAPSHPLDTTPSPASTATPSEPNSTATAELQAPMVPNAGQSTTPPSSEPLFPWQNDSRVATRPDATASPATVSPTTEAPQPTFNPPAANPPTTQPTFNPPSASGPTTNGPAIGPALNGPTYPETNLRDAPLLPPAPAANPAPPPASAPAAGQGGGRAPSRTYPASFTSAPGGNRYERTGSGLY